MPTETKPDIKSKIITGAKLSPPKIILYGGPGIGKTTFAAMADALLVDCENGAGAIANLVRTPYLQTWPEIKQWLADIADAQDIGQRIVAIDTIDWCINRITEYVVIDLDGKKPQDITNTLGSAHGGYFKAREIVVNIVARELLRALNQIVRAGKAVLLLAHASHQRIMTPEGYMIETAAPDIPQYLAPIFIEWADCVLYAHMDAEGKRRLRTSSASNILAKNRYSMPEVIDFSWQAILDCLKARQK
ncbi:MAG: ATP-binding protein [Planctomycetota bacterium]|nr:ATP-binding protein [Planctomycetota bacterium]